MADQASLMRSLADNLAKIGEDLMVRSIVSHAWRRDDAKVRELLGHLTVEQLTDLALVAEILAMDCNAVIHAKEQEFNA